MSWKSRVALHILFTGSALSFMAAQASAQEAAATPSSDEIIVTAQKRSERINDVPLSIIAASGEQLDKLGITETSQLTKLVPGFTFQLSNYGSPVYSIRGVGFFEQSVGAVPTITTYVDQAPLPFAAMTRGVMLDLERVEVLKGPQGTLFGMNSTGGAINYIAAKPTASLAAGVDVSYGRFNEVIAGGFISGPLTDTLRARLSVRQETMDGWQVSATRPHDRLGKKNFRAARLLVDWDASDALSFEFNATGWQDKSDSPASQFLRVSRTPAEIAAAPERPRSIVLALASQPRPDSPRVADWDADKDYTRDDGFYFFSLRGDWRISDKVALTSLTSYAHLTTDHPIDLDGTAIENFVFLVNRGLVKSFSQELRLNGEAGRLKWMAGANYQRQTANEYQHLINNGTQDTINLTGAPTVDPSRARLYLYDTIDFINNQNPITSKSVFASGDYDLTDQLTFHASGRYTDERRKFTGCLADGGPSPTPGVDALGDAFTAFAEVLSGVATPYVPGACITLSETTLRPVVPVQHLNEDNFSWRVGVDWKPDSNTMLYATVAKGYKVGSFTVLPAVVESQLEPVTQESLLAYEAGFKLSLADRKVQLNGAAFYYDYTDKQLVGLVLNPIFGLLSKLVNIPKSRVWGLDFDATIRPVEGLRITGGVTYVNSRVLEDVDFPLDPDSNPAPYLGRPFPNTPKWQGTADAEYGFPLNGRVNFFLGSTVTFRTSSRALFAASREYELPSYVLLDLRAGAETADGKWRAQIFGRNVTNKYYWVHATRLADVVTRSSAMPATYGISLTYRY